MKSSDTRSPQSTFFLIQLINTKSIWLGNSLLVFFINNYVGTFFRIGRFSVFSSVINTTGRLHLNIEIILRANVE